MTIKIKWTEAAIRAEAAKYSSKVEFRRSNGSAHNATRRFPGLIDELFENQRRSWDEQSIRAEAAKYSRRVEFFQCSHSAYAAARRLNLIDELFDNKYHSWDEQSIRAEAAKYSSKVEFFESSHSAYVITLRRFPGLLDELFDNQQQSWDEQSIRAEAAKYSSKKDFDRGNTGAYRAAHRLGIIDELFDNQPKYTDADVFYIWQVEGHEWFGKPVFKFGITSARIGMDRIKGCASSNRIRAVNVQLFKTDLTVAKGWEDIFHDAFPTVPDLGFGDGKTEFRACDPAAVQVLVDYIQPAVLRLAA